MRILIFALFAALLVATPVTANAQSGWTTYQNTRFGFSVRYPADIFSKGAEPANNDGRVFTSSDGRARFTVSASLNVLDHTPQSHRDYLVNEIGVVDEVTYQRIKGNWMVLSGFQNGKVYYEKTVFSCHGQVLNSIIFIYDAQDKPDFDKYIGPISKSLKSGTGYGSPDDC